MSFEPDHLHGREEMRRKSIATIVITGSIAYDYIMSFPGYFREHILPEKMDILSASGAAAPPI